MKSSVSNLSATYCHQWRILVAFCSKFLLTVNSHIWRNRSQLDFPGNNDSKATTTSSNGPKKIFSHWFSVKESTLDINQMCIKNIISSKAIFAHHCAIPSPTEVSTNTHSIAKSSWKAKSSTLIGNPIVHFTHSCTRLSPGKAIFYINKDVPKIYQIKDKWHRRNIR